MMNDVRWFHEIGDGELSLVGGKGANLGAMARAGFPVPPGFCLVAPAYRAFIERTELDRAIGEILAEMKMDDPAGVEAGTNRIRGLILDQPIPATMAEAVLANYRQLALKMDEEEPDRVPVAVRSSATAEDLPDYSFAGQQDTYLNVRGEDELLRHVRMCWASLWTARATVYRAQHGFDHLRVYLAVVVQAMVQSEISGILFTANPVSGSRDEVVVNPSWGLGEAIVSGNVNPDTVTVRKNDRQVVSYQLGDKERSFEYAPDGGIVERQTEKHRRDVPALTDEQVAQLTEISLKVESYFGKPQDIEWAYARGHWYVLQARPITTLKAAADPAVQELADQPIEYNRTMFIEIFPDPLSPIFLSVVGPLFRSMLDYTFKTWGFKPVTDQEAVGVFYNQPYFSRNYVEETLSPLSPKVRESLVAQIVNPFGSHRKRVAGEWSLPYLRMALATFRFLVRFPKKLPGELERYQAEVSKIASFSTEGASDGEIVSELRRLVFDSARRLLDYDFLMIAIIGRTYRMLGSLLEPAYGQDADEKVARLISGVTGNITMETNKRIWDLAQLAKASPAVSQALGQSEPAEARLRLSEMPEAQPFLEALDHFLDEFGHREIRMDVYYPTWKEDPAPVFGFVRSYLDADEGQSPYAQQERLVRERQALTGDVLDRLGRGLTGRLFIAPIFRWVLAQAQEHTRERDTMHFELTRLFPPFRRLLAELGRRWSERGFIASPEDVYFLQLADFEELAESPRSFIKVAGERRAEFKANQVRPWPDIIRGGEEIFLGNGPAEGAGESLQGVAGSPGLVSGISRVIRGPDEFDLLKKGDILVAPLTNPVWTPLFAVAGGLITEVGGILSHGAIVAREYGIPAVMSIPGATRRISDGQAITIDGNTGMVYLQTE